jgi:cytoskeletal protein CcmA (bactofilin family)
VYDSVRAGHGATPYQEEDHMFGKEKTQTSSLPTIATAPSGGGAAGKIETIIGPTANFKGTIQSDGGLRVDGVFEGVIQIAGNLIIGESGKVIAEVSSQNVSVAGALKGSVKAAGRLEILSTGRVWGDISVSSFLIDEGGFFRGQSIMPGEPDMPLLDAPAAPARVVENGQ